MSKDIIEQVRSGNEKAFYDLYRTLRIDFIDWASFSYDISREEAKDVYQETFIVFWNNIHDGKLQALTCDAKTYLFGIGKHLILNLMKKNKRSVTFSSDEWMNVVEQSTQDHDDCRQSVELCLQALPVKDRRIIELYYLEEKDMKTIARELGYKNSDVAKKRKYEIFRKLTTAVRSNRNFWKA